MCLQELQIELSQVSKSLAEEREARRVLEEEYKQQQDTYNATSTKWKEAHERIQRLEKERDTQLMLITDIERERKTMEAALRSERDGREAEKKYWQEQLELKNQELFATIKAVSERTTQEEQGVRQLQEIISQQNAEIVDLTHQLQQVQQQSNHREEAQRRQFEDMQQQLKVLILKTQTLEQERTQQIMQLNQELTAQVRQRGLRKEEGSE